MQASILIISKNRKDELALTLQTLQPMIDVWEHEVLVFLDGCTDGSELLKNQFKWVIWDGSEKSIGASGARNALYPKARGQFFIGLDDDAHPLNSNFINETIAIFDACPNIGIIAFQEIKGIFHCDSEAINKSVIGDDEFYTNEFVGCGFAIQKKVYEITNGFPVWIDIYGEESCVSIEVIAKGYDIMYSNKIKVNHRVNLEERKIKGQNHFRFGKQLKNTTYYFLVYYPFPIIRIFKLYYHNLRKYALTDFKFFKIFFKTTLEVALNLHSVLKYREPVSKEVIKKMRELSGLKF